MNYIYDILIDLQTIPYDIYEWNKEDEILHVRKIPLFLVSSNVMLDLLNCKIKLDNSFLEKIYRRTELFGRNHILPIDYGFLVTDKDKVCALKADKNGYITSYSSLLLEEEMEVLEYANSMNEYKMNYQILRNIHRMINRTRKEMIIESYIQKEIHRMIKNQEYEKLQYLYLDCFNELESIDYILKNIYKNLQKKWDFVYLNIYQFLKLTVSKK